MSTETVLQMELININANRSTERCGVESMLVSKKTAVPLGYSTLSILAHSSLTP